MHINNYYEVVTNESFIEDGKQALQEMSEAYLQIKKDECAKRVLDLGKADHRHEEICALIGLILCHSDVTFGSIATEVARAHNLINLLLSAQIDAHITKHVSENLIFEMKKKFGTALHTNATAEKSGYSLTVFRKISISPSFPFSPGVLITIYATVSP